MEDKIRQNAKKYFDEELSGEPLYQDLVIDWLTEFAQQQVKLFAIPDVSQRSELLKDYTKWLRQNDHLQTAPFPSLIDQYFNSL